VRLRCEGRIIDTFGIGFGAGQTLVRVWPETSVVLQLWLARTTDPCTQSQFQRYVNIDSAEKLGENIQRTAEYGTRLAGKSG
jgi:hypothetical protein